MGGGRGPCPIVPKIGNFLPKTIVCFQLCLNNRKGQQTVDYVYDHDHRGPVMTVDDQGADDSCRRNEQNGRNGMIAGLGPRLWVRLQCNVMQCNGMIAGLRPSGCNALQQQCCQIEEKMRKNKRERERERGRGRGNS